MKKPMPAAPSPKMLSKMVDLKMKGKFKKSNC